MTLCTIFREMGPKTWCVLAVGLSMACNKKTEPYVGAPKLTFTAHGAVTDLATDGDAIWFCDARGARSIDVHGNDVSRYASCPSAARASKAGCVQDDVTLTAVDGGQLVWFGGHERIAYEYGQTFPKPVVECARDGDHLVVANADGVFLLDDRADTTVQVDAAGAKYAVVASRWFAWSDGATVHFSRRDPDPM